MRLPPLFARSGSPAHRLVILVRNARPHPQVYALRKLFRRSREAAPAAQLECAWRCGCRLRRKASPCARVLLTNLHSGSCAGPSSSRHWQRSAGQSCRAERRGSGCGGCSKRRIDVQRIAQGARNLSGDRQTQRTARRKSIQVPNAQDASVHTGRNQGGSCLSHRCDVCIVVATHAS